MYSPDRWCLIKINGPDPHYRVFASWVGGLPGADSWRINSGIARVEETDVAFKFYGVSGSCYACNKELYGWNSYSGTVIHDLEQKSNGIFECIRTMPDVMSIKYD